MTDEKKFKKRVREVVKEKDIPYTAARRIVKREMGRK